MKKIFLTRHAKTVKTTDSGDDFDRFLKLKGQLQAHWLSGYLNASEFDIEKAFSSPAVRTEQTAKILFDNSETPIGGNAKDLYMGAAEHYINLLTGISEDLKSIAIVGHNPGISDFGSYLLDEYYNFSTCQCMVIEFKVDNWVDIIGGSGFLKRNIIPQTVDLS